MIKTVGDELLKDIIAHPDDNTPRLVYADWLEEHSGTVPCTNDSCGNPAPGWNTFYPCRVCRGTGRVSDGQSERAEFIRVQCELAGLDWVYDRDERDDAKYAMYAALRRRERELLAQHALDWIPELEGAVAFYRPGHAEYGWATKRSGEGSKWLGNVKFRRGFVEVVHLPCYDWLEFGPRLVRAAPLHEVQLSDYELRPTADGMLMWHYVSHLRHLTAWNQLPVEIRLSIEGPHHSKQEALDRQSAACLAWARSQCL